MRKHIKRILLALALAGALAASAQPLSATTPQIQRNEGNRLWQHLQAVISQFFWPFGYLPLLDSPLYPYPPDPLDIPLPPPGGWPTPPPLNNDFAADEADANRVLNALR